MPSSSIDRSQTQGKDTIMETSAATGTRQPADQIQHDWDTIAAGYDQYVTPTHQPLANEALDRIDIRPGMRFLDVAAGSGALGIAAARRGAEVLGTDISPGMVGALNDNARRYGLTNLTGEVMDGHDLDLDDDAFDASGSMFGVMLFPDLPRGLREMARVTKPGGKVLVITFGAPKQVEFLRFFLGAAKRVVPDYAGLPLDPPPLPFQVSDPATLHQAMNDAGLNAVRVETTTETQEFRSATDLWNWVANSHPIGARLTGGFSSSQATSVLEVLDVMLQERSGGTGPARLTNPINIAVGTA
jgi:ubiquinone/menaquinone biosynthesis C-methylase UbiE